MLPDWASQIGMIILGGSALMFSLAFGIQQFRKLTAFLSITNERPGWREANWRSMRSMRIAPKDDRPTLPDRPDLPQHDAKVMFRSLIKFLVCQFIFTLLTFEILIYPMIIVWGFFVYFARKYIILWKAHKYSVPLLIGVSLCVIAVSIFSSPFIRMFFLWAGRVLLR